MSEPRIRWEPLLGGNFDGYAGTMTAPMFEVHLKVKRGAAETWALRSDLLRGYTTATHPDTLKATAERWLEEYVSSLGASFAVTDAACSFAKTWQELLTSGLSDGYGCTLNCDEADAAADLYRALGNEKTAAEIIRTHAAHDDEGDAHYAGGPAVTALERQMAADDIALSKEHAGRADAADARWQALKDYLTREIEQDVAAAEGLRQAGDAGAAAAHYALVSANRSALAKMRELGAGQ